MGTEKKKGRREFPHVKVERVRGYDEYRVSYKGLRSERAEAMAYYTDDLEDAEGTAEYMENMRFAAVYHADIRDQSLWSEYFTPVRFV